MIIIKLRYTDLPSAQAAIERIRGSILSWEDSAIIADGGIEIFTQDPVRVCQELAADGFVD
jgi:hypothetical protein